MIDRGSGSDSPPSRLKMRIFFFMSSVAQLEVEISIGRGLFEKKTINPDLIKLSKNSANVNNCILSEIFILNYKSLECKLSDLWYLKVEPKFGVAIGCGLA